MERRLRGQERGGRVLGATPADRRTSRGCRWERIGGRCGHTRRHRHGGHVHRSGRGRRVQRRVVRLQGPLQSGAAGGGARRGARAGAVRPRRRVVHGRRHDDRHQRGAHPHRRPGRLPHHEGVRGRPAHPADQPQEPLRLRVAQAARRSPSGATASAWTSGSTPRGEVVEAARPGLPPRPAAGARRRGRRRGRVLPLLLPEPGVRAGGARRAGRDRPRPPGLALARDRADLARVRARDRGDPRRVPEADLQPLRGGRHRGVRSPGRRLQVVAAEVQRRSRAGQRGAEPPRPRPALGHRRRGDRRRVLRPRARGRPRRSCSTWAGRAATSA